MNWHHNCSKNRYRDHQEAITALHRCQRLRWLGDTNRREVRAYECDRCNGWHLTSHTTWHIPTTERTA